MDMNSFYVTLPSNNSFSVFPKNTTTTFTTQLYKRVELTGSWEVTLVEFQYPATIYNVRQGENHIGFTTKTGASHVLRIKAGFYESSKNIFIRN